MLADAEGLLRELDPAADGLRQPVLVPNKRGLERAIASGVREIMLPRPVGGCSRRPWPGRRVRPRLVDLGVGELSLGDTIGVATPGQVVAPLEASNCRRHLPWPGRRPVHDT